MSCVICAVFGGVIEFWCIFFEKVNALKETGEAPFDRADLLLCRRIGFIVPTLGAALVWCRVADLVIAEDTLSPVFVCACGCTT